MADRALQKLIHAACREIGIDAETRREMQVVVTGKDSMSKMNNADLEKMKEALVERGWKPDARKARSAKSAPLPRADQRFVWVLWNALAEAGKVKKGEAALHRFINSDRWWKKYGLAETHLRMCSPARVRDVIEGLKDIAARNGVEVPK